MMMGTEETQKARQDHLTALFICRFRCLFDNIPGLNLQVNRAGKTPDSLDCIELST